MPYKKSTAELKAELAEARRTIRDLEEENEVLQQRIGEIAGIANEGEEEDEEEEDLDDEEELAPAC